MKELNISANYLRRDITEVVTTLIHECSHIWNMQKGIKDTSNGYIYHNKHFKQTAEELGKIKISRSEKYGWTISSPTEETVDFCIRNGLEDIQIGRQLECSFGTGFHPATAQTPPHALESPAAQESISAPVVVTLSEQPRI